jgi:3-hydroxyacyl-CoA dehydrogenase/enoyl-CoA hydratase/3-hydroxybutyryl-CoA epimerase
LENLHDPYYQYFQELIAESYNYAVTLVPSAVDSMSVVDIVMESGFNWRYGPSKLAKILKGQPLNEDVDSRTSPLRQDCVLSNEDALLYSYNGCLIFTIKTKLHIFTAQVFELLNKAIDLATHSGKKLIIHSFDKNFSAGGDLRFFLENAKNKNFSAIRNFLKLGQDTLQRVKYCDVPVISIAQNLALGGGCELLLQSNFIISGIELRAGLVEVGIGLIPAWGGLKEMILRASQNPKMSEKLLSNIIMQNASSSADFFAEDYLVNLDIVPNSNDFLSRALNLDVSNWQAPQKTKVIDLSSVSYNNFDLSKLDKHTCLIVEKITQLLNNAEISEENLLEQEIEIFMDLVTTPAVIEKISKILKI